MKWDHIKTDSKKSHACVPLNRLWAKIFFLSMVPIFNRGLAMAVPINSHLGFAGNKCRYSHGIFSNFFEWRKLALRPQRVNNSARSHPLQYRVSLVFLGYNWKTDWRLTNSSPERKNKPWLPFQSSTKTLANFWVTGRFSWEYNIND